METSIQAPALQDIQLSATQPEEMITAQKDLIVWVQRKIKDLIYDARELKEAVHHAKKNKWRWRVHQRHHDLAIKRIEFYDKLWKALEAGYYIVPNFPISLFAIRTDRKKPKLYISTSHWQNREQDARALPATVGEYKNPNPVVHEKTHTLADNKTVTNYWAEKWQDEIEFPVSMAKPQIMEATSRAMALKIFDQFGILPAAKKEDPLIIGQIKLRTGPYSFKTVSFMIAWHLDTNVL